MNVPLCLLSVVIVAAAVMIIFGLAFYGMYLFEDGHVFSAIVLWWVALALAVLAASSSGP